MTEESVVGAGAAFTPHPAPAAGEDVREPTDAQVNDACMWYRHDFGLLDDEEKKHVRFQARGWFRAWGKALSNGDDAAALLRTPRGEGEVWRDFLAALDDLETAANLWVEPDGPTAADVERLRQTRQRVIACARALAALRSEAQGEDRWEDVVFGPITEAYNEAHAARRGEGGGE